MNPIDGSRILFDVYGNERVSSSGHRDIGAVQALAPVPLPSSLLLLMGGVGALLMKGSRRRCRLCLPFGFSSHAALRSDPGAKALMTVIPGRHSTVPDHAERNHNHGVRTMTLYSRKTATILLAALLPFGLAACDESASTSSRPAMAASCPSDLGGNECEYYMDGYRAGADDGAMGMSMAYQRHEGYDLRFEPYFARGYEAGWTQTR